MSLLTQLKDLQTSLDIYRDLDIWSNIDICSPGPLVKDMSSCEATRLDFVSIQRLLTPRLPA